MDQLEQWHIRMENKIEKILIQTTKTNGRVDNLSALTEEHEEKINGLLADNNQTKGGNKIIWIVLGALGTIALVLIGWYLNKK